ncbi:unnamed protein product [Spirodela intermedia]|uniref:Uncharacterized protein n=1 Tax=Spirodela intermedia TaxID=51605 RepID=A0A7I8JWJ7_SPIIN|nr:unnamed protein product [Spirodela intermedia]
MIEGMKEIIGEDEEDTIFERGKVTRDID